MRLAAGVYGWGRYQAVNYPGHRGPGIQVKGFHVSVTFAINPIVAKRGSTDGNREGLTQEAICEH